MKHVLLVILMLAGIGCAKKESAYDSRPDIVQFSENDAKMEAAIKKAQETIDEFIARLPKLGTSVALVKWAAPTVDGSKEHIWVDEVDFANGKFTGKLANEPAKIAGKKIGDTVTFAKEDASDWMIFHEDGREEGGFTTKVMEEKTGTSAPNSRESR